MEVTLFGIFPIQRVISKYGYLSSYTTKMIVKEKQANEQRLKKNLIYY